MTIPKFEAGDIVLFHTDNIISGLMRHFQTHPDDKTPTKYEHTERMVDPVNAVGARATVVKKPLMDYLKNKRVHITVVRIKNLTIKQKDDLAKNAISYIGKKYGWVKILWNWADYYVSKFRGKETVLFRNMNFNENLPICSMLVAEGDFKVLGYLFAGKNPNHCQPDNISDDIFEINPSRYEIVYSI